ncbi:hypothetical protein [Lactobacillus sp. HT06-2]|uniref:hypothetical protein n=1 Tax=Lactobacillus sp. HT06-2 TaxID=2080222 RepID=UPI00137479DE|nr:hypothetical protein [Lactobacillus sp. HT06-2]
MTGRDVEWNRKPVTDQESRSEKIGLTLLAVIMLLGFSLICYDFWSAVAELL